MTQLNLSTKQRLRGTEDRLVVGKGEGQREG